MKYLCIHGHFYQPPRENAWLETIERQDSAAPYHDWNARIAAECYGPNALARVLNSKNELIRLIDNYAHISFNFGPTLLSWMQENTPDIYQSIFCGCWLWAVQDKEMGIISSKQSWLVFDGGSHFCIDVLVLFYI